MIAMVAAVFRHSNASIRPSRERARWSPMILALGAMLVAPSDVAADVDGPHSANYEAIATVVRTRLGRAPASARLSDAFVESDYALVAWRVLDEGGETLLRRRPDRAGKRVWAIIVSGGGSLSAGSNAATELTETYAVPLRIAIRLVHDAQAASRGS